MRNLEQTIEYLKQYGKKIGVEATSGNEDALELIKWYDMLYRCPGDPMAQSLVIIKVDDWEREYNYESIKEN